MRPHYWKSNFLCLLLLFGIILSVTAQTSAKEAQNLAGDSPILEHVTVQDAQGNCIDRINIFIGDVDERSSRIVKNSSSFNKDTYGDNYYALYDQADTVEEFIAQLPKDMSVNLIGHGAGGATAALIAVDFAQRHRIDTLATIDPVGKHPDFALIRNSVNKWVNVRASAD